MNIVNIIKVMKDNRNFYDMEKLKFNLRKEKYFYKYKLEMIVKLKL